MVTTFSRELKIFCYSKLLSQDTWRSGVTLSFPIRKIPPCKQLKILLPKGCLQSSRVKLQQWGIQRWRNCCDAVASGQHCSVKPGYGISLFSSAYTVPAYGELSLHTQRDQADEIHSLAHHGTPKVYKFKKSVSNGKHLIAKLFFVKTRNNLMNRNNTLRVKHEGR